MLARDSESRHAVGAENEIPDIAEYSGGEAGFFQIWSVRAKKILARGRGFYIGRIGDQQREIISKRDPACPPGPGGRRGRPEAAPREQPGSALRERLAKVQALNEDRPLPVGAPPGGALPVVSGVPPEIAAGLVRVLAGGALPASAAGQALGMSKSAAHRYLSALREAGVVETTGACRAIKWRLVGATPAAAQPQPYTTIEALAQAVHDGLVDATDEQREVLEQAWQITQRRIRSQPASRALVPGAVRAGCARPWPCAPSPSEPTGPARRLAGRRPRASRRANSSAEAPWCSRSTRSAPPAHGDRRRGRCVSWPHSSLSTPPIGRRGFFGARRGSRRHRSASADVRRSHWVPCTDRRDSRAGRCRAERIRCQPRVDSHSPYVDTRFSSTGSEFRVLVTAGAGGIGAAIARHFTKPGCACTCATWTAVPLTG